MHLVFQILFIILLLLACGLSLNLILIFDEYIKWLKNMNKDTDKS